MFKNVCRLCLGTNDLLWVFDEKISDNMADIIKVTSGVEILKTDNVTQMVCGTCCQITLKMYKFRTTSIKNDSDLKAQYAVYNITQLTSGANKKNDILCDAKREKAGPGPSMIPESRKENVSPVNRRQSVSPENRRENVSPEIRRESVSPENRRENIRHKKKKENVMPEKKKENVVVENKRDMVSPVVCKQEPSTSTATELPPLKIIIKPMRDRYQNAHFSIKELIRRNPNMKIPKECVNSHIGPYITLLTDEVDNWFKERNYTDEEIARLKKGEYVVPKKRKKIETKEYSPEPSPPKKPMLVKVEDSAKKSTPLVANKFNRRKVISELVEQAKSTLCTRNESANTPVAKTKPCDRVRSSISSDSSSRSNTKNTRSRVSSESSSKSNRSNTRNTAESEDESMVGSILRSKPRTRRIVSSDDDYCPADDGPASSSDSSDVDEPAPMPSNESASTVEWSKKATEMPSKQSTGEKATDTLSKESTSAKAAETPSKENTSAKVTEASSKENTSQKATETPSNQSTSEKTTKEAPPKNKEATTSENPQKKGGSFPDPDFEMFTTRPFLRKPKYIVGDDGLLIISDSDEEQPPGSTNGGGIRQPRKQVPRVPVISRKGGQPPSKATGTLSDPIVLDDEGASSKASSVNNDAIVREEGQAPNTSNDATSSTNGDPVVQDVDSRSSFSDSDKASFTEALDLVPADSSNTPNMSLLSANKTLTLYTCKVCDSQRQNLWDLKQHMKKTHTKCPFCSKRFKTLDLREEHVKNECTKAPVKMKILEMKLVRVEEDEEIRKKYPKAFEVSEDNDVSTYLNDDEMAVDNIIEPKKVPEEKNENARVPERESTVRYDTETEQAVLEIEKFLSYKEDISPKDKSKGKSKTGDVSPKVKKKNEDVICISDEEPDSTTEKVLGDGRPRMKIVDSEILRSINTHTSDLELLKTILLNQATIRSTLDKKTYESIRHSAILDGNTNRVKIFKNLRKHLNNYKIPILVSHKPDLKVQYLPSKIWTPQKKPNLWGWMMTRQIKQVQPSQLQTLLGSPTVTYVTQSPQSTPMLYEANLNQSVVPTNFNTFSSTSSTTCASSTPLVLNSTNTTPFVLNGTPSTSTNSLILNNHNFLVVPNAVTTLPAQQGPLPVIESVSSAVDIPCEQQQQQQQQQPSASAIATLESITNSLMPMSPTGNSFVTTNLTDKTNDVFVPVSAVNKSFVPVQVDDVFVPTNQVNNSFLPANQTDNSFVTVTQETNNANMPQRRNSTDQSGFWQQPAIRVKDLKELS